MENLYEEKRDCEFCKGTGCIEIVNFKYIIIENRLKWNSEKYIKNLIMERVCPLCEGKSYLHIIKQRLK